MNRLIFWLIICMSLALTTPRSASAQNADKTISLFNGRDLTGWVWHGGNAKMEDVWVVRDGVLICRGNPAGYIGTGADYTNFVLRLQWRFDRPGNSGVLLRLTGPDKV